MKNSNKISDLSGIATLTVKGGYSPLRMGEIAMDKPFDLFFNQNINEMKFINVSDEKLDGIIRRQGRKKPICNPGTVVKSLVKHINVDMLYQPNLRTVKEVTGKEPIRTKEGKVLPPVLTLEANMFCCSVEWAMQSFGNLPNLHINIQTSAGNFTKQL